MKKTAQNQKVIKNASFLVSAIVLGQWLKRESLQRLHRHDTAAARQERVQK